ncbi:MAG: R3H domain-containing nucleic acid-binding protein [Candidatus Geothermincolales bacterium]
MENSAGRVTPKSLVVDIVNIMDLRSRITCWEDDETIHIDIWGEDLGLLIGKGGATLEALQEVVAAIIRNRFGDRREVVLDVEGYKERKRKNLVDLALRVAERVKKTGRPVKLDPMTKKDRKIVHETIKELPGVESYSEGKEPHRRVVIVPGSNRDSG